MSVKFKLIRYPPLFGDTLMIRVTYRRQRKYFPLLMDHQKVEVSEEEFGNLGDDKKRKLAPIRLAFQNQISHYSNISKKLDPFDLDAFARLIKPNSGDLFVRWEDYAKLCEAEGRISTAESHRFSLEKFKGFNKKLSFESLNVDTLKRFQVHGKSHEWSQNTIAICLRNLRTIVNQEREINPATPYPFLKKSKFKIMEGEGKRGDAMRPVQLKAFMNGEAPPHLQYAKDIFLFMVYAQGMNHEDLMNLKYDNIKGDRIEFVRAKTSNTTRKRKSIVVPIDDFMRSIIIKYGNPDKDGYLFPIRGGDRKLAKKNHLTLLNKHLKAYCKSIKLDLGSKRLSSYWSRHTYASLALEAGVGSEVIKQALGHTNIQQTEAYLRTLTTDQFRDAQEKIKSLL